MNLEHRMLAGSHESRNGPECRCGFAWDRRQDACTDPRLLVADLTKQERAAIAALKRLCEKWPDTLTLASMDGSLYAIRHDHPDWVDQTDDRQDAIMAEDFAHIPNTGGGW